MTKSGWLLDRSNRQMRKAGAALTHNILLSPTDILIVIVEQLRTGDDHSLGKLGKKLERLCEAIGDLDIPAIGIDTSGNEPTKQSIIGNFPSDTLERLTITDPNPWEADEFRRRIQELNRKRILVAGCFTDECVTFTALSALEEGYEVYLLTDCVTGTAPLSHKTAILRMLQAGAVPITVGQMTSEIRRTGSRSTASE